MKKLNFIFSLILILMINQVFGTASYTTRLECWQKDITNNLEDSYYGLISDTSIASGAIYYHNSQSNFWSYDVNSGTFDTDIPRKEDNSSWIYTSLVYDNTSTTGFSSHRIYNYSLNSENNYFFDATSSNQPFCWANLNFVDADAETPSVYNECYLYDSATSVLNTSANIFQTMPVTLSGSYQDHLIYWYSDKPSEEMSITPYISCDNGASFQAGSINGNNTEISCTAQGNTIIAKLTLNNATSIIDGSMIYALYTEEQVSEIPETIAESENLGISDTLTEAGIGLGDFLGDIQTPHVFSHATVGYMY